MRAFIQVLSPAHARRALHHVSQVLVPGGALYIIGQVLDDSRLSPLDTVTCNLFLVNIYEDGQAYTEGEYHAWLRDAMERLHTRLDRDKGTPLAIRMGLYTGLRVRPAACALCRTPTLDGLLPPLLSYRFSASITHATLRPSLTS